MFRQIVDFLAGPPPQGAAPDMRLAIAILLLEAAHRDDSFAPEERTVIERLLTEKFSLSAAECADLMARGEAATARITQLHPYTSAVFERMEPTERIHLIEMLWEVAFADGVLDPEEDALIRRLGNLIHITDRDRVLARQRVLARIAPGQA